MSSRRCSDLIIKIKMTEQESLLPEIPVAQRSTSAAKVRMNTHRKSENLSGYDALQARIALNNSIQQNADLENRIRRLAFE